MLGIQTTDTEAPKEVRLIRPSVHASGVMEYLADLDDATKEFLSGSLDVRHDQVQPLSRTRCCSGDILAEDDRTPGAWRCKLHHTEVFTVVEVSVEPPSEPLVELFRPVDI